MKTHDLICLIAAVVAVPVAFVIFIMGILQFGSYLLTTQARATGH